MANLFSIKKISADTLEDNVIARTSKEDFAIFFPHATTKGSSNDVFYSQYSTGRIVQDYIRQGMATYEDIRNAIENCIRNGENAIIEGHQITPVNARSLIDLHGKENIRSLFLLKLDEKKMTGDFKKSTTSDDWILRKTNDPETFPKIARMISEYSQHIASEAKKYRLDAIQMDEDFDAKIEKAIEILTKGDSDSIEVR